MKRRIFFRVVLFLTTLVLIEGASFVVFWILEGRPFSYSTAWEEQHSVAGEVIAEAATQYSSSRASSERRVVHPYLGYIPGRNRRTPRKDLIKVHGVEFYEPDSPLYHPSADTVLIGISGGSVAAGFCALGTSILKEELLQADRFAGQEIVIVWLAGPGFKQPQALMTLNYLLALGGHLDLFVNIDGFNEVALHEAENGVQDVFPIFPRNWSSIVRANADFRSDLLAGEVGYLGSCRVSNARAALRSILRFSIAHHLVWRTRDRRLAKHGYEAEQRLLNLDPLTRSILVNGPSFNHETEEQLYDELVAIWKRCSVQLHQICLANDIQYFHFLQPNQYVEDSKPLSSEERKQAYDPTHPYYPGATKGYPRLIRAGKELVALGVSFFDLTRIFSQTQETLYIDGCCHFNRAGHQIMAREVARRVLQTQR